MNTSRVYDQLREGPRTQAQLGVATGLSPRVLSKLLHSAIHNGIVGKTMTERKGAGRRYVYVYSLLREPMIDRRKDW